MDRIQAAVTKNDLTELKSRVDSLLLKMKQENRLVNRVSGIILFELFRRV